MNRETLKSHGLTDEQINNVMKDYGKSINDYKEKAESVDSLRQQIEDYKNQISDRDTQLKSLSEKVDGNEELKKQIQQLQEDNEKVKNEYEDKLNKQSFDHLLERTLVNSKARNVKAIKPLLDLESIKRDGDRLLGLDDQLTALKESDSYLFDIETDESEAGKPVKKSVIGGNPNGGENGKQDAFEALAQKYK